MNIKLLQIIIISLCVSFCFIGAFGQKKSAKAIILKGTVQIETITAVSSKIDTTIIGPIESAKTVKKREKRRKRNSSVTGSSLNIEPEIQIVKGAVITFTDEKGTKYLAKTDEKGKFEISLPIGKYSIYATVNEQCWMCAEYYNTEFLITDRHRSNLNIILRFFGEG